MLKFDESNKLFAEAKTHFPGGVNSPVRAFGAVGGSPIFFSRGEGAYLFDADGQRYIDYVGSWGPMIIGHADQTVLTAVKEAMVSGLSFGAPTHAETLLAKMIKKHMPSMEQMRFVSSGTEACMAALRLARGFTGRQKFIKFTGCYHGHADPFLVKAGSGMATFGIPGSAGVPESVVKDTLTAPFNDLDAVAAIFQENKGEVACIIIEPFVGNGGFLRPNPEFLPGLRAMCDESKALLIFDEVMTGFRVGMGGAQGITGVRPDITTLGKVVGGGMPVGVYGGRRDIMANVAPEGPVYQAGTLSGNPVAMACGLATLERLQEPGMFEKITASTNKLVKGLNELAGNSKISFIADSEGGMFGTFMAAARPNCYEDVQRSDLVRFKEFFWHMLHQGIYLAPSAFEAGFVSAAHSGADIDGTINAARRVLEEIS